MHLFEAFTFANFVGVDLSDPKVLLIGVALIFMIGKNFIGGHSTAQHQAAGWIHWGGDTHKY